MSFFRLFPTENLMERESQNNGVLSYGNATQRDSPHFGDQLELFSKKEMRDAWFLKSDVDKHAARIEIKVEKGFEAETKPN
jgi:acyl-homoserine-lactone acylase